MGSTQSILPPGWELPPTIQGRLGETVGRQRALFAEEHLLLVLHKPPKPEEDERVGRFFWRQPNGEWKSSEPGNGLTALKEHLDAYETIVDDLEARDAAAQNAAEYFDVLTELGPVRRASDNLHRTLQHARELIPQDRNILNLRDESYQLQRAAELLYHDAKNALDFKVAQRAEEQATHSHQMALATHRLNVLAAFFFPIVTLTAVFGVNLKHGFEESMAPLPFLALMAMGLLSGLILKSFVVRKA